MTCVVRSYDCVAFCGKIQNAEYGNLKVANELMTQAIPMYDNDRVH